MTWKILTRWKWKTVVFGWLVVKYTFYEISLANVKTAPIYANTCWVKSERVYFAESAGMGLQVIPSVLPASRIYLPRCIASATEPKFYAFYPIDGTCVVLAPNGNNLPEGYVWFHPLVLCSCVCYPRRTWFIWFCHYNMHGNILARSRVGTK